jgi:hypothetical protein
MKTHLHKFLTKMAEHHVAKAKHHSAKVEHHHQLGEKYGSLGTFHKAKHDGADPATIFSAIAEAHAATAEEHSDMSQEHGDMAEACIKLAKTLAETTTGEWSRKAAMGDDLDKLVPTAVSAVAPNRPGITAVPRAGMQPLPTAAENPLYAKVFGAGTDE